jgi:hypothetical protein
MPAVLFIFVIAILLLVAYQDFRFRAVTWVLFPLLAVIIFLECFVNGSIRSAWDQFIFNISFIALQLVIITLYFSLRSRSLVMIWKHHLGAGDMLFFVVLCMFFSPVNFVLFHLGSLLFSILLVIASRKYIQSLKTIPLAGIQAVLLALFIVVDLFSASIHYRTDPDLTALLYGAT